MTVDLRVNVAGVKLRNPTMLAAGILGFTEGLILKVWEAGAGAVVSKSIGLKARAGYPNPTVVQVKCGIINAVGLPNPGIDEFREVISHVRKAGAAIIVSVYGYSPSEFLKVSEIAEEAGAVAIELNVSCPHAKGTGSQIGQDPELLSEVVRTVKGGVNVPVIVKLTPNVTDIVSLAEKAVNAGADAITAINTVRAIAINIEVGRPILANKVGGLSGPAIKPIALRCVYDLTRELSVPVIGCGGILDWRDAVEFLLAGASAIQVGSAILYKDLAVFSEINEGIASYLERKGFRRVEDIVGLSHRY